MTLTSRFIVLIALICGLQACSSTSVATKQVYDLGPIIPAQTLPSPKPQLVALADINAPSSLDSNAMLYRLLYDNAQQTRPYAQHSWSMPPAALLSQALRNDFSQRGLQIITSGDSTADIPVLKIELEEFAQLFDTATSSSAQITVRASVFSKRKLVGQRSFSRAVASTGADAPAGAKAMALSTHQLIADVADWMHALPALATSAIP